MSGDCDEEYQPSTTLEIRLSIGWGRDSGDRNVEVRHAWTSADLPWNDLVEVFMDALRAAGYHPPESL